ncbi:hypothetical protein KKB18_08465, partial [bacterium]|nr:hypothetical protein [bacterium]
MFNQNASMRWISKSGSAIYPIALFVGVLSLFILIEPSITPVAKALLPKPMDADGDCLPDIFEAIYGTNCYEVDSDSDGCPDGVEYAIGADPMNSYDSPVLEPGLKLAAYKNGEVLKLCFLMFPGDLRQIENFLFIMGYAEPYTDGPLMVQQLDLSALMPIILTQVTFTTFKGVVLGCLVVDVPMSIVEEFRPLSFGTAIKYSFFPDLLIDIVD